MVKRSVVSNRRKAPPAQPTNVELPVEAEPDSLNGIRLVAIDLDGTLLNDSKQVSTKTVNALRCLGERGINVIIASARPPRSVRHIYNRLRLETWQINYNGALIWDEHNRKVIFHRPMPGKLVRKLIDTARKIDESVLVTVEILDRWFTDRLDQPYTTETGRLFKPDVVAELHTFCNQPITKLLLLGSKKLIDTLEQKLTNANDGTVAIVRTDAEILQIMEKRVSKAAALQIVAEHYGVPIPNIMAIGDAPNDVGIIRLAGVGIAMNNAHPLVKEEADWIAPSNNDHGVHAALVKYGLCD